MKCGRVSFLPALAHFGRFGGLSRKSGPTDHPARKSVLKRKSGKNKLSGNPVRFGRRWPIGNEFQKIMQKFLVIKIY